MKCFGPWEKDEKESILEWARWMRSGVLWDGGGGSKRGCLRQVRWLYCKGESSGVGKMDERGVFWG